MNKISRFQLYGILLILTIPLNILVIPKYITAPLDNNAWLAVLAALLPGLAIIYIYAQIIKKSKRPFPLLLEEHLGYWPGKIIAAVYIPFFLLATSFNLRILVDFIETNVLPDTPSSVFIGLLLITGFAGLKAGLTNIARYMQIINYIGIPFTLLMLALALAHSPAFGNLQPIGYMELADFIQGTVFATMPLLNLMPVLTFAYYTAQKHLVLRTMFATMLSSIFLITLATISAIVVLGGQNANLYTFPTFITVRLINIANFIQNIDIIFIGVWIIGISGALTLWWFMACYTAARVFKLHDYRFLAAPTALIIGVGSIMISPNIIDLNQIAAKILHYVYYFFLLLIPLVVFIVTLFKAPVEERARAEGPPENLEASAE